MTLAVHIDGPADAPAIVLLHAIATSSALWTPQLGALSARFRVLRIDLPGHGDSAILPGLPSYSDYADAVAATLRDHGIGQAAICGLSFGAMVTMQVAVRHRTLVRAVVLGNCAAFSAPPVAAMWHQRIAAVEADGMDGQRTGTLERWFTPAFAAASPLTIDWIGAMIAATPEQGFVAAARMISTLDHRALLPQIICPALVLSGAHDHATTPTVMADIAAALPYARLVSLDAAHLANVEAPVAFTEAVGGFLSAS